ncbi:MAG: hypothetical protein AB1489_39940 [Acidobacteriota bacterium]
MRLKSSIVAALITFMLGVGVASLPKMFNSFSSTFSKAEAIAKIGSRVRYVYNEEDMQLVTCKKDNCHAINTGERGTVTGITEIKDEGYFLIVQWDSHSGYQTFVGREGFNTFLKSE